MKKLGTGAITTGSGLLVYTVPTGIRTEVMDICIANTSSSDLNCWLHFVPSGGAATTDNAFFPYVSIPAKTMVNWIGVQVLNAGDFIRAIGSNTGMTIHVSGDEYRAGT